MDYKLQILLNLISSIIVAFLTVKLTVKKFITEKWWEKKASAYDDLIENLAELQNCAYKWVDYYQSILVSGVEKRLSKEEIEKLRQENIKLTEAIRKISMAGSFMISNEAVRELNKLLSNINAITGEDPWEDINKEYSYIMDCITDIRAIAKKDLSIN